MAKRGRPTKYKKKYCDLVLDKMEQGFSKEACAGFIGISKDTLYRWIKEHKDFSDSIKEGETKSQVYWEKMGNAGMLGQIKGFNATAWIFNMKNRSGWRDKQDITSSDEALTTRIIIEKPEKLPDDYDEKLKIL